MLIKIGIAILFLAIFGDLLVSVLGWLARTTIIVIMWFCSLSLKTIILIILLIILLRTFLKD